MRPLPASTVSLTLLLAACTGSGAAARDATSGQAVEADAPAPDRELPFELIEGEPMYTVLPFDAIPSIDTPVFVDAAQADAFLAPDEPVLGVVGTNGTAKAYSTWHLEEHEIVNDVLDGEPIAATW